MAGCKAESAETVVDDGAEEADAVAARQCNQLLVTLKGVPLRPSDRGGVRSFLPGGVARPSRARSYPGELGDAAVEHLDMITSVALPLAERGPCMHRGSTVTKRQLAP